MAIYKPGQKFRSHFLLSRNTGKRGLVAVLNITAMVDMFTVLVIFLLQNYSATGEIIYIPKEVKLPKAEKIKELKPAVVVTISSKEVLVDRTSVITYDALKASQDWMVKPIFDPVKKGIADAKAKFEARIQNTFKKAVDQSQAQQGQPPPNAKPKEPEDLEPWNKITVQADKGIDFLSVKKIMFTVTEAMKGNGSKIPGEINFAVMKDTSNLAPQ